MDMGRPVRDDAHRPGKGSSERAVSTMSQEPDERDAELRRMHSQADAREGDIRDMGEREQRQDTLIERLHREAKVAADELAALHVLLEAAQHELEDLRAIRDALTPSELPQRPGLELAAAFVPAAEQISGDFYLVAEGPQDSTLLVIGDVVGHGLQAGRRAAFVRTAFAATAPFSDDPRRLLSWANTALVERAGTGSEFVTAGCVTYLPNEQLLRWAYAGHPPALRMHDGRELVAPSQGLPLGVGKDPEYLEGSLRSEDPTGVLLYTDGLTEARHNGRLFGVEGVAAVLGELHHPSASEAIAILRARVAEFADGSLTDDLCMLAACID
jgi:serine phosphatase RsbU (regulator of sigma subunit)